MEIKQLVKKHLKTKSEEEIKEILNHSDILEIEKWLIYYTFAKDRLIANTCMKLNISERQYHNIKKRSVNKIVLYSRFKKCAV